MPTGTWRGVVGVIKPGHTTASVNDFIRLMPEGVGVIPLYAGIREHTHEEYLDVLQSYNDKVAELAKLGVCDLIHPEGAPPFMLRGYQAERQIVADWEAQHRVPIFTSGMTQTEALRALGIKRLLGLTYETREMNQIFEGYFAEAGFDVLAIEEMGPRPAKGTTVGAEDTYRGIKKAFLRHPEADGIYLQGSSSWRVTDVIPLEEDLGIPVLHPVAARVWYVQRRLRLRQPVKGAGRLLEQMP